MIDPRDHGASDKPHDPAAHTPEARVGDMVAILDHLGIDKAHYDGHSNGGAFGYHLAIHAPARFLSLPGCGHVDNFGRVDLVAPEVPRFLAEVDVCG